MINIRGFSYPCLVAATHGRMVGFFLLGGHSGSLIHHDLALEREMLYGTPCARLFPMECVVQITESELVL